MATKTVLCPVCGIGNEVDPAWEKFQCHRCGKAVLTAAAISFTAAKEKEKLQKREAALAVAPKPADAADASRMLERASLFLEDGEWDRAWAYADHVLDFDPKNARAYEVQLVCDVRVRHPSELTLSDRVLDDYPSFNKAVRYADKN